MTRFHVGIDPGASGGIAVLANGEFAARALHPMPATDGDLWALLKEIIGKAYRPADVTVSLERVGGFVAGNPLPGSTMFKFGRSYGLLVGLLTAAGVRFEEVTPQKWQKAFGIGSRGEETKTAFKNRLKAVAQKLFPTAAVTLKTCDALLLAEYDRRFYSPKREPDWEPPVIVGNYFKPPSGEV